MKQSFLSSALSMFGRGKKEERCAAVDAAKETKVYFEEGGTRYHTNAHCSGMRKPQYIPLSVAKKRGLSPCKKCAPYGVSPTVRPAPAAPLFASATTSETKPAFEFLSVKVAGVTSCVSRFFCRASRTLSPHIFFRPL